MVSIGMTITSHSSSKSQSDPTSSTGSTGDTSKGSTSTTPSSSLTTESAHTVVSQPETVEHRSLSSGALAGICLAAIIVLGILVLVLRRARKRKIESSKARGKSHWTKFQTYEADGRLFTSPQPDPRAVPHRDAVHPVDLALFFARLLATIIPS